MFHYYDETKGIYVSGAEIVIESQAELITDGTVSTSIVNEAMNHRLRLSPILILKCHLNWAHFKAKRDEIMFQFFFYHKAFVLKYLVNDRSFHLVYN